MNFSDFVFQDWLTIVVIIAQAGVIYYRLKKVEEATEKIADLITEMAVMKNSLKNHQKDFEKFSHRTDILIQKLDDRVSGIEVHAFRH